MYEDEPDDSIPPLDRPGVAPLWRGVAILALLAVALFGSMVVVLFMALDHQANRQVNNAPPMAPVAGVGGPVADAVEDVLDANNPAYPTRQDLRPPGTFPLAGGPEADPQDRPESPRRAFRQLASVAWDSNGPDLPERVLVSPDEAHMAFTGPDGLMVGPVGAPNPVDQDVGPGGMPPPVGRWKGGVAVFAGQPPRPHVPADTQSRLSGWSPDGFVVAWVAENGRPCAHDMKTKATTRYEFKADALLPLSGDQLADTVVVSSEPRPKLDDPADHDRTSVKVLPAGRDAAQAPALLAGPERSRWDSPALSPDGKRLAIVSDRGEKPGQWRVFVLALDNKEKVEAVSPPADRYDGVCWTPDGKELVYARSESPLPADHAPGTAKDACDLFLLDLATRKETRLSRGGGFTSPSVTKDGELYFLTRVRAGNGAAAVQLLKVELQKARAWAESQEKARADKGKEWKELAGAAFQQAGVRADAEALEAGHAKKLAEAFAAAFKEKIGGDPPATAEALEWQRREVAGLELAPEEQARFCLLLGAVEGEYLVGRQKGSEWHTTKERGASAPVKAENAFGYAFNPFRPLRPSEKDDSPQSLAEVLYRAEGRRIVLGNDATSAKDALDKLVDPDLARGSALLAGVDDAADTVLLETVKRHEGNQYLVIEVGTLLQRHGRTKALARLAKPLLAELDRGGLALARDPLLYNLMGVGALGSDTDKAILAFQDALRCDLNYGPAYLNLAQAYQKASRPGDARLCLRRYLKLFPEGEWADDARRRLAAAGDE